MGNKVPATNVAILNAVRSMQSLEYQSRIPEATAENISSIYESLLNIVPLRNAFANALVEQIMEQRIETVFFENPLGVLKRDPMRYGGTEEEIFINMAKGKQFNQFATVAELYAYYQSSVMAAYHKITPPIQYAVTVTFDNLRTAFRSEYGVRDLINAKVQSLFAAANWDEYLCMKRLIESASAADQLYAVNVADPTASAENAKKLTKLVKAYIGQMKFPHPEYNIAGADSCANDQTIFYITTPEIDAELDVEVLATAFNMDKVDINVRKIIIDKFDDPNIKLALFDMRFFNVRENFRTLTDSRNGAALTWNYFYTMSEMFSYSPFFPCIVFTTDTVGLTTVSVTDTTGNVGTDVEVTALVTGTDQYTPQMLDFDVEGATSQYTSFIPGSNILHIANDEKAATLTVKATSRYKSTVSGTGTITVNH